MFRSYRVQTGLLMILLMLHVAHRVSPVASNSLTSVTIVHVDDDAPVGGDGTSWAMAFRYLRDAVDTVPDKASVAVEIRVAEGVYYPDESEANPKGTGQTHDPINMPAGVKALRGGFGGLTNPDPDVYDPTSFQTVLNGDLNDDDVHPGFGNYDDNTVYLLQVKGNGNVLVEGFTFEGGYLRDVSGAFGGGAIRVFIGGSSTDQPVIRDCTFLGNWSAIGGGGAISIQMVDPNQASPGRATIENCKFLGNQNTGPRGGGAVHIHNAAALVRNCIFSGNTSEASGGALSVYRTDQFFSSLLQSTLISNSVFYRNQTTTTPDGGALWNFYDSPGPQVAHVQVENSVIWTNNNLDNAGSRQVASQFPDPNLTEVTWCIVQPVDPPALGPNVQSTSNIFDVVPDFVNPSGLDGVFGTIDDDYHLQNLGTSQTLVDMGNNDLVPLDLTTDLDGNARILDGNGDLTATVDIGPYEIAICPDFNNDGMVNVLDLLIVLSHWGPCEQVP